MLFTLSARCQGSSHKKENKPLQDYCAATSDKLKTYAYALVADGHGGEKYIRS
ncbi:MAG: protein phosphatase 2C domain-containing protein [Spirochaetaceae bacterium]|nr:protein phosphatase 2C domain-containing protein [Spirochaetaceae bacterium]